MKHNQKFNVYDGDKMLICGKDYTFYIKNNQNAYELSEGEKGFNEKKAPQVVLKMKGDYSGSKKIFFKIYPVDLKDVSVQVDDMDVTYTGRKQTPTPEVYWNGKKLTKKDFYVKEYKKCSDSFIGDKERHTQIDLTLVGKRNFTGERTITLTIGKKGSETAMSKLKVTGVAKKVAWNKEAANSEAGIVQTGFQVMDGTTMLIEGRDYTVHYENNHKVGNAFLVITGTQNRKNGVAYHGVKRVNFAITGTKIKDITINNVSKIGYLYTGEEIQPLNEEKVIVTLKSGELVPKDAYRVEYEKNVNKGTGVMILTGVPEAGYTGTKKVNFKILPANLDHTYCIKLIGAGVKENIGKDGKVTYSAEYVTGGTEPNVQVYNAAGKRLVADVDYMVSYRNNKTVASICSSQPPTVIIKGKGNYTKATEVKFNIVQKVVREKDNVLILDVKDKVESTKKNNWKQSFKILETNQKALSKKDYLTASYVVESVPEGYESLIGKTPEDTTLVPAGSVMKVNVKLTGNNYKGEVTGTYRILEKDRDISKAVFKIATKAYTGEEITISEKDLIKAQLKKNSLKYGEDFIVERYEKNFHKGTAKVVFRGINEYGGKKTVTFMIGTKDVVKNWFLKLFSKVREIGLTALRNKNF